MTDFLSVPHGNTARRGLSALARNESGSTSAMMVAAFIPVLLAVGGGVDLGRNYVVKSQLQTAVDSAALAAAQSCKTRTVSGVEQADTANAVQQANAYYEENFSASYMGGTRQTLRRNMMCGGTNFMRVSLTGSAVVPYTIMRIAGLTDITISASAAAETGSDPATIEAVMVLDVTGSMLQTDVAPSRIAALRNAANSFIDILYQNQERQTGIAIGIVPYNIMVNVGDLAGTSAVGVAKPLGNTVASLAGFTDEIGTLGWSGCVKNDSTIKTMSNDIYTQDAGAWDIRSEIAGFDGSTAPRIEPMLYYPSWTRASMTASANPSNNYWQQNGPLSSTLLAEDFRFRFSDVATTNTRIANSAAYREYFYRKYIALNDNSGSANNDVITTPITGANPTGGYYNPSSGIGGTWVVRPSSIPGWTDDSKHRLAAPYGYSSSALLNARSPNQQCPGMIRPISYGQTRTDLRNYITNNIQALAPGGGTIHHTGMLWGHRVLQNTVAYPRTNPTIKTPKRYILFMTDGNYEFANWAGDTSRYDKWKDSHYSAYDRIADSRIIANATEATSKVASNLRFAKVCEAAKRGGAAVYVVALRAPDDAASKRVFETCAPGDKYKEAATSEQLSDAFNQIAREIIDLHLVS